MKTLILAFLFVIWMIFTLVLTASIIGLLLFIPDVTQPSTWMKIGKDLKNKLIE